MLQEMNTGMLLLRSTAGAVTVCEAWVQRMTQEMVTPSPGTNAPRGTRAHALLPAVIG